MDKSLTSAGKWCSSKVPASLFRVEIVDRVVPRTVEGTLRRVSRSEDGLDPDRVSLRDSHLLTYSPTVPSIPVVTVPSVPVVAVPSVPVVTILSVPSLPGTGTL